MGCKECADGDHLACIAKNKDKTTGCPGCCQHKVKGKDGVPVADRFAHLTREMYELSEIAYMLKLGVRTVRGYTRKDSQKYPDRKLLVAKKERGVYRVLREDLKKFFNELYGG
jgi:hypothetical protein